MDRYEIAWLANDETAAATHTHRFMRNHGIDRYEDLVSRSVSEPEWFWPAVVDYLGLPFDPPWLSVRDTSRGHPWSTDG